MKLDNFKYTDNAYYLRQIRNDKLKDKNIDMICIGDSITEGLNLNRHAYINFSWLNTGLGGDISSLMLKRLDDDCLNYNPKVVSLLIGINDIRNYFTKMDYIYNVSSEEELINLVVSNYKLILDKLSGKKVILTQILPINEDDKNSTYINSIINNINDQIFMLLSNYDNIYVIKNDVFKNRLLNLDLNLTYDGLHLNDYGYSIWINEIMEVVYEHNLI